MSYITQDISKIDTTKFRVTPAGGNRPGWYVVSTNTPGNLGATAPGVTAQPMSSSTVARYTLPSMPSSSTAMADYVPASTQQTQQTQPERYQLWNGGPWSDSGYSAGTTIGPGGRTYQLENGALPLQFALDQAAQNRGQLPTQGTTVTPAQPAAQTMAGTTATAAAQTMAGTTGTAAAQPSVAEQLKAEWAQKEQEANAANEARYSQALSGYEQMQANLQKQLQDIIGGYQSRYGQAMQTLQGMGAQEGRDIRQDYHNLAASGVQDLASRGLGNSTFLTGVKQGAMREQTDALGRLNDRLRQQQLGYQTQLQGDTLNAQTAAAQTQASAYKQMLDFIERREDVAPDYVQMANLMRELGYGENMGQSLANANAPTPGTVLVNTPGTAASTQGVNPMSQWFLNLSGRGKTATAQKQEEAAASGQATKTKAQKQAEKEAADQAKRDEEFEAWKIWNGLK